jgi:hypothetical protein
VRRFNGYRGSSLYRSRVRNTTRFASIRNQDARADRFLP